MDAAAGGGKPSAVVVCGHSDDTIVDIENLGKPGSLTIWYLYYVSLYLFYLFIYS